MALLKCRGCGQECNGLQGIRGHLRWCPGREQAAFNQFSESQDPMVEPGIPVVRAQNQQVTLGSRLDAKGVEVILRTHEALQVLHNQIRDALPIRQSLDCIARTNKWPTYDHWFDLGRNIVRLKMATEHIIQIAYVSRDGVICLASASD